MLRILISAVVVIGVAVTSQSASARPLSLLHALPLLAALAGLAVLALALYWPSRGSRTADGGLLEGRDYARLRHPQPTATAGGLEVVLAFDYNDPVSHRLEPLIARWAREYPAETVLIRLPVIGGARREVHARAYYAAHALGVGERLHGALFDARQVAKRTLDDEEQVAQLFATHGIDPAACRTALRSATVQTALHKAELLNRGYQLGAQPALIVDGTYKIDTAPGSPPQILRTLDRLAASCAAGGPTPQWASGSAAPPGRTTRQR